MTIYVHFRGPRAAVKLHNVSAVEDAGPRAVRVRNMFTDSPTEYTDVRTVAVEPEQPDDDGLLLEGEEDR